MSELAFSKVKIFSPDELSVIVECIKSRITAVTSLSIFSLHRYHDTHGHLHHLMSPKSSRELGRENVELICGLPGFKNLRAQFTEYEIGRVIDEHGVIDEPEIYFRLVRPQFDSDVGVPHADNWFHTKAGLAYHLGSTYKVWVAIVTEPGLSGLCFYPSADVNKLKESFFRGNQKAQDVVSILGESILPDILPGEGFIFRDDVVHGGALNKGFSTRCSIEITFVSRSTYARN